MEIIAFIEEWTVIRKILKHLGLWERPQRRQVRASTDAVFWDDVPVYRG